MVENVNEITNPNVIQFPKLGWEFEVDPTAFTIPGTEIGISWYGLIITFGLLLAIVLCFSKIKKFGINPDRAIDVVIVGVVGGIIGARAYYVIMKWEEYAWDWKAIFNIRSGGLAIYGGLIGAILLGFIACKVRKVRILPMLDVAVMGFLLGQGIGRWGNFVNQEAFGTNTDSIFGMTGGTIQETLIRESAYLDGEIYLNGIDVSIYDPVHPCFLYESVWCLLGFVLLFFFVQKRRKYDGQMFLMYLTWYGAERFVIEGLRTDSLMIGELRVSQVLSAILVIVSVVLQIIIHSKRKRDPEKFVLYCTTKESAELMQNEREEKNETNAEEPAQAYESIIADESAPEDDASDNADEINENTKDNTSEEEN